MSDQTEAAIVPTPEEERLRGLLRDVVVAAGRILDDWSESDQARKGDLWRGLHTAAQAAWDDVYPLAAESDDESFITNLGTGMRRVANPPPLSKIEPTRSGPVDLNFQVGPLGSGRTGS